MDLWRHRQRRPLALPVKLRSAVAAECIETLLRLADDDECLALLAFTEHVVHRYRGGRRRSIGEEYTMTDELLVDAQNRGFTLRSGFVSKRENAENNNEASALDAESSGHHGEQPPKTAPPRAEAGDNDTAAAASAPGIRAPRPPRLVLPGTPAGHAGAQTPGSALLSRRGMGEGRGGGNLRVSLPTLTPLSPNATVTPQGPILREESSIDGRRGAHARASPAASAMTPRARGQSMMTSSAGPLTHRRAPRSPRSMRSFSSVRNQASVEEGGEADRENLRTPGNEDTYGTRIVQNWLRDKDRKTERDRTNRARSHRRGLIEFAIQFEDINKRRRDATKRMQVEEMLSAHYREALMIAVPGRHMTTAEEQERNRKLSEIDSIRQEYLSSGSANHPYDLNVRQLERRVMGLSHDGHDGSSHEGSPHNRGTPEESPSSKPPPKKKQAARHTAEDGTVAGMMRRR